MEVDLAVTFPNSSLVLSLNFYPDSKDCFMN